MLLFFVVAPLDSLLVARQRWFLQYIFVSPTYPFVLWVSQGKQSEHRWALTVANREHPTTYNASILCVHVHCEETVWPMGSLMSPALARQMILGKR